MEKQSARPITRIDAGKLRVEVYESREAMGKTAAQDAARRIAAILEQKEFVNVVFAAAPSQNELLASLVQLPVRWERVNAFHMDEYVGLPADAPQRFGYFLSQAVFDRVPLRNRYYMSVPNLDAEGMIERYARLLMQNPPDLVLCGIGENGHLAFNDPHVADFNDPVPVKVVDLDRICRQQQVNDGCFAAFDDVPEQAVTLTLSMLLAIPEVVCVVPGPRKADAVWRTVHDPIDESCPSTALRRHPQATLYADRDSAGRILKEMQA